EGALYGGRRRRRASELRELTEDDRELERRGVAAAAHLAVAREPEERLEQHLGLECGLQQEACSQLLRLRREDAVLRRRRHRHGVPRREPALATADDEAERAVEHLVQLALQRVEMVAGAEAARHERQLVLEQLAAGLGRGAQEDEPAAG